MDSKEVVQELKMSYDELVKYLLKKYGASKYDYFRNESCATKDPRASRTNEGLYIHHIDEDKAIKLSSKEEALNSPWKYQKADRLVYCNALEHLILHIKIVEKTDEGQGVGGAVVFICPQINECYDGREPQATWVKNVNEVIKENFEEYIDILKYFLNVCKKNPFLKAYVTKEKLSFDTNKMVVKKIYNRLK